MKCVLLLPIFLTNGCLYTQGSGHASTRTSAVTGIDTVVIDAPIDVSISVGGEATASLTTDDNLQDIFTFDVAGTTLYLQQHRDAFFPKIVPAANISLATLVRVDNRNSGTVTVTGLSGGALDVVCEGAGPMLLSGSAGDVSVETNGAATVDLSNLVATSVTVTGDATTVVLASD